MSNINTPATIEIAPEGSQELLKAVQQQLGSVPNMFRIIGNSPQALEGYIGLNSSLAKGKLSVQTRESIALAIAEVNGCHYCLAAHNYLGTNLAKLSEQEIMANRAGKSLNEKASAAVQFAVTIAKNRGAVSDEDLRWVRNAGYSDSELVEIIAHVALNTLTNYMNEVLGTDIDFPKVDQLVAA